MQDKDLTPRSSFVITYTTKKPSKILQKGCTRPNNTTTVLTDNQRLMLTAETPYHYDSVKAFKKLDSLIRQLKVKN
jgi:hypothetical protein